MKKHIYLTPYKDVAFRIIKVRAHQHGVSTTTYCKYLLVNDRPLPYCAKQYPKSIRK